tara:strand:+ start:152 stop:442 length:291 start_codon:yes stop_codon:yes gene_type:complete
VVEEQKVLIQEQLLVQQVVLQFFQQLHLQVEEVVQVKLTLVFLVDQVEVVVILLKQLEQEILLLQVQLKVFLVDKVDKGVLVTILVVEVVAQQKQV